MPLPFPTSAKTQCISQGILSPRTPRPPWSESCVKPLILLSSLIWIGEQAQLARTLPGVFNPGRCLLPAIDGLIGPSCTPQCLDFSRGDGLSKQHLAFYHSTNLTRRLGP